ncbi:MAG TPA: glycosyltransferase family 9 protein [Stellaceae bacterium]|nr:glycosyltransferase family 9 protein [Stellaceae bacterium]
MRKILFVTATRIGDAVLSTGLLGHLVERHPGARFTIAAGPDAAPLFEAVPGLDRLVVMEKRRFALHWALLYGTVAVRRWDLVVDLRGSALAYVLWTRDRKVAAKGDYAEHRVVQLARLFALDPPPAPRLWLAPHHLERAAALVPAGGPVLAIGPAANWRGKEWRAERFAELACALTAPDGPLPHARVAVLAAAHERAQAQPVLDALPQARRIDLVGRVDLLTAAAALKRCALFVGNDTGLMHIAAATGIPTLGLFGPSLASHYAPWGKLAAVVSTSIPAEELFQRGFDHRTTDTLMDSLGVEAAEAAARSLLERVAGAAA